MADFNSAEHNPNPGISAFLCELRRGTLTQNPSEVQSKNKRTREGAPVTIADAIEPRPVCVRTRMSGRLYMLYGLTAIFLCPRCGGNGINYKVK